MINDLNKSLLREGLIRANRDAKSVKDLLGFRFPLCLNGLMAMTLACRAGDPSSILGWGVSLLDYDITIFLNSLEFTLK